MTPETTSNFRFEFLELDTEYEKDFVKILRNGRKYAEFSGDTLPEPISFDGETATIVFTSNGSRTAGGFKIVYSIGEASVESIDNNNVSVYPNPANAEINIDGENIASIQICNLLGVVVYETQQCNDNNVISTDGMGAGNYFVRVTMTDGKVVMKKIIVL